MWVKQFGESLPDTEPKKFWYETDKGERIYCVEETVAKLWCYYITLEDSDRADTEEFTIFVFGGPVDVNIEQLENRS